MNGRGEYGKKIIPLYGGSLYSSPPWGGAPDQTAYGWPYHGPRAFHGHEAPAFGRGGSWPPRREPPFVGAVPSSPEAVKEDLSQLQDGIFSLNKEIQEQRAALVQAGRLAQSPLEIFYKRTWQPFYDRWRLYYDAVKDTALTPVTLPLVSAQVHDYQSRWLDTRVDAHIALDASKGIPPAAPSTPPPSSSARPSSAPAIPPSSFIPPGPAPAPMPEKDSSYGLYAALGIGAIVAVAAAALAFRHAEAA